MSRKKLNFTHSYRPQKAPQNLALAAILFMFSAVSPVQANQDEIAFLIKHIESSPCLFIRNGEGHSGPDAVKHIQKKYDYFKEEIKTTEDFIEYSATKSTMSKKPYMIQCPDQTKISTKRWLLDVLEHYRQKTK